jgi:flagellar protein FlgJ
MPITTFSPSSEINASGVLDKKLSFDVQGVDALRRTARASPQEGLKQASKQFEVMFMSMVIKSMRDATTTDGMLSSQQESSYTSMLDQQLAQNLSGKGLGLAEKMLAQINRNNGSPAESEQVTLKPLGSAVNEQQFVRGAVVPKPPVSLAQTLAQTVNLPHAPNVKAADLSFYEAATAQASLSSNPLPRAQVEKFFDRILPAAQRTSKASGVPAQLIMAQAALESGWGKREIQTERGTSFNLFGIKADKSWKGPVVEATTNEYVNGNAQKTRATFRVYGSYDEAFADYAKFLTSNPRYSSVVSTRDPVKAADGLQRAGYATDPNYSSKLVRIMQKMT